MLDPQLTIELQDLYQKLVSDGAMLSRDQLRQYYATFRDRFGPERLRSLDGEALLSTMHDHGDRESLVYWLEFKDDEEFLARFGSIAGGSALKFGLYRRKETGAWMTGSPTKQTVLARVSTRLHRAGRVPAARPVRLRSGTQSSSSPATDAAP